MDLSSFKLERYLSLMQGRWLQLLHSIYSFDSSHPCSTLSSDCRSVLQLFEEIHIYHAFCKRINAQTFRPRKDLIL